METFTSGQVAALFQITTETVRVWAQEFAEFLSPDANPGGKRNRRFDEDDLTVFALVSDLKTIGKTFQDAHVALSNGQRGVFPEVSDRALAVLDAKDKHAIAVQVERLQNELEAVRLERDQLLDKLNEHREMEIENARLKSERDSEKRRAEVAEGRVEELTNRLIELQMESGQARGELAAMLRILKMRGEMGNDDD